MYCPECDGEGVGVWDGEYVACKYCGGTGIYQGDGEEGMLWESYYEPDDKRRVLLDEDEWCDYSGWIGGPSFSDPF